MASRARREEEQEEDDVTLPLMLALERLSPLERAAFLLHDVFGLGFEEIAERSSATRRPAASSLPAPATMYAMRGPAFGWKAARSGDRQTPSSRHRAAATWPRSAPMLAADVSLHADGGGKRPAAWRPVLGFDARHEDARGLAALFGASRSTLVRTALINGLPGFVTREADGELQTTALEIEDGKITAIYVVRNPDKLRHLH